MNYFIFALRNLRKKGVRSLLTLLGIFIGVLAVVSLITLGNAMQTAVTSQFGVTSTEVISVQAGGINFGGPPGSNVVNPLTEDDVEEISHLSGVEFAVGRNIETVIVEYKDVQIIGAAISVPEGYEKELYEIVGELEVESGSLLNSDPGKILLGNDFLNGDKNGFGRDLSPGKNLIINGESFEISGILKKEGSFIIDGSILIYDDDLREIANYGENADLIGVKVRNKDLVEKTQEDIEDLLRRTRNVDVGEEDFSVQTPESVLSQVNQVLGGIQAFIVIIAMISVVVGGFGIVNTMGTAVLERRKEIGIMKAIGATNSQIFSQFFIESGFLGLIGGFLGVTFGILIGYVGTYGINSWLGSSISPEINLGLIFFALFGSFLIGAISGIAPAMRAAKQNPVDALRGN